MDKTSDISGKYKTKINSQMPSPQEVNKNKEKRKQQLAGMSGEKM